MPGSKWPLPWWGKRPFSKAGARGEGGPASSPTPVSPLLTTVTECLLCAQGRVQLGPPTELILNLHHTRARLNHSAWHTAGAGESQTSLVAVTASLLPSCPVIH